MRAFMIMVTGLLAMPYGMPTLYRTAVVREMAFGPGNSDALHVYTWNPCLDPCGRQVVAEVDRGALATIPAVFP